LRPAEAAELLSISRSKAYELIAAGVLPSVRVGGSVRVPAGQLHAWIDQHIATDDDHEANRPMPQRKSVRAVG
jgi:excisionase family DNA binding protein